MSDQTRGINSIHYMWAVPNDRVKTVIWVQEDVTKTPNDLKLLSSYKPKIMSSVTDLGEQLPEHMSVPS